MCLCASGESRGNLMPDRALPEHSNHCDDRKGDKKPSDLFPWPS